MSSLNINKPLYEYCRNATNVEGDTFVGIKSELVEGKYELSINFPLGFKISKNEEMVRNEILKLMAILQDYNDGQSKISQISPDQLLKNVKFPVQAFFTIIRDYANNGPYRIKEDNYKPSTSGSVNWSRTIKQEEPLVTKNGIVYNSFRVKEYTKTDKDLITEINMYCVYESYMKMGWIYKLPQIQEPPRTKSNEVYKDYLNDQLLKVNKDKEKQLFRAMKDVLDFSNNSEDPEEFYFGTNKFEYIWEKLIQSTFSNVIKEKYFPRTKWILEIGREKENTALEPDTIMKYDNNVYVLDAKYYKYGVTKIARDLPPSSSINKQISYGEYIATNKKFEKDRNKGMKIYNAFIMPYNKEDAPYNKIDENYYSIGEARSDWKNSDKDWEKVQGILLDVKMLMNNVVKPNQNEIMKLSKMIEESIEKNKGL